jgi:pyrroline-5-carboxylate reductase
MVVGLIGAGNMAGALARGWSTSDAAPDEIVISDVDADRARGLAQATGARQVKGNRDLAQHADVIVLAMKPAALRAVAEDMRAVVADRELPVVSILGATPTAAVVEAFGPATGVLRFMPNVAAEVGHGTFCHAPGANLNPRTEQDLLDLFGLLGDLVAVDEHLMEAATAISGCGPAFFALVVEALTDAGVREGLPATVAERLAVATMRGTAELLHERGGNPVAVRRAVTSPGGVTAAGVAALEDHRLRAAFANAVRAVVERAEAAARSAS